MFFRNRIKLSAVTPICRSLYIGPGIRLIKKLLVLFVLKMQVLDGIQAERVVFDFIDTGSDHACNYSSGNAN